jgi:putative peptidoglycan lipid II flippase
VLFFLQSLHGLIFLRDPVVNILFQRGRWDYAATVGTSQALLFYSFGIWAVVGVRVVAASFYSMQDTKTPVKIAVIAMTVNVILSLLLMKPLKHSGLALANAIASSVNFTFLFIMLRKKLGRIEGKKIVMSFIKISLASAVTGLMSWFVIRGDM